MLASVFGNRWMAALGALVFGTVLALAILAGSGTNPFVAMASLINGSLAPESLSDTINWAVPLVGMTLAAAIPLRAGIINLGGDGQVVAGGLVAALVAIYGPQMGAFTTALAVLAAIVTGGLVALVAALGETRFRIPLLISSLLLSYPIVGVASYLVTTPLADVGSGLAQTVQVPEGVRLGLLGGSVNAGAILILLICVAVVIIDRFTVFGMHVQVQGRNSKFALYSGVNTEAQTLQLMAAGGAVAGLVGGVLVLGSFYRFIDGALLTPGYTYSGLMAALVGNGHPLLSIVTALFFSALQTGGFAMQRATGVPRVFTTMMQAAVVLVLTLKPGKHESHD